MGSDDFVGFGFESILVIAIAVLARGKISHCLLTLQNKRLGISSAVHPNDKIRGEVVEPRLSIILKVFCAIFGKKIKMVCLQLTFRFSSITNKLGRDRFFHSL